MSIGFRRTNDSDREPNDYSPIRTDLKEPFRDGYLHYGGRGRDYLGPVSSNPTEVIERIGRSFCSVGNIKPEQASLLPREAQPDSHLGQLLPARSRYATRPLFGVRG